MGCLTIPHAALHFTRTAAWGHAGRLSCNSLPGGVRLRPLITRSYAAAATPLPAAPTPEGAAQPPPVLLVVDGHYLACRAYYGFNQNSFKPLTTEKGVPTTVTYSVLKTIYAAVRDVRPTALLVVFDSGRTWRHALSLL